MHAPQGKARIHARARIQGVLKDGAGLVVATVGVEDGGLFGRRRHLIDALLHMHPVGTLGEHALDVATGNRGGREDELAMAGASRQAVSQPAPRRDAASASNLPAPDFGPAPRRTEAPPVSPGGNDGWLSDLLNRSDDGRAAQQPQRQSSNPLEALSLDIARLVERDLAAEMWDRYQRGERKAFSKRLYTPAGQKAFDEVSRKYRADRAFKQTVDRYINEFERLLDEVSRDERGPAALRNHLVSETGLVYTLLAHAAGRLG